MSADNKTLNSMGSHSWLENFTLRQIDYYIYNWCKYDDACFNLLSRYFPMNVKLPIDKSFFSHLLGDISSVEKTFKSEISKITITFGIASVVSIAANTFLLCLMYRIPYRSSAAIFLTWLMFLDLHEALTLAVKLFYLDETNASLLSPRDTWQRELGKFSHLLWWLSYMVMLLLVAIDRWFVYDSNAGRLFARYRKTTILITFAVTVAATVAINDALPSTMSVVDNGQTMEVYLCIRHLCMGSSLMAHTSRAPNDNRKTFFWRCFQGTVVMALLVFLPFYVYIWSTVSTRARLEKRYLVERQRLSSTGQEITYFNDNRQRMQPRRNLPVIYEVDENHETQIIFPYSVNILHRPSSLCWLGKQSSFNYDFKPVPENAVPLFEYHMKLHKYDNAVDDPYSPRVRRSALKPKPSQLSTSVSIANTNYSHSVMPALLDEVSQTTRTSPASKRAMAQPWSSICNSCQSNHRHHTDSVSSRQIVFSISCCCNKTIPIQCHTQITYMNDEQHGNALRSPAKFDLGDSHTDHEADRENVNIIAPFDTYNAPSTSRDRKSSIKNTQFTYASFNIQHSDRNTLQKMQSKHKHESNLRKYHRSYKNSGKSRLTLLPETEPVNNYSVIMSAELQPTVNDNHYSQKRGGTSPQTSVSTEMSMFGQFHENTNWNKNVLSYAKRKLKISKNNETGLLYNQVNSNVPAADLMSAHTMMIMCLIRDHFLKHSNPLMPLGIPESLESKDNILRATRAKTIIGRLIFLTLFFLVATTTTCLMEILIVPFNTILYISYYFVGSLQFLGLLIFDSDLKRKFWKSLGCYRKKRK